MSHARRPTIVGYPSRPRGLLATPRRMTVILLGTIVACGAATVLGTHGFLHLLRLRTDEAVLAHRAFVLLKANADLRDQIVKLHTDDHHLEMLARQRLGLVREDEIIYRFPSSEARRPRGARRSRVGSLGASDEGHERHGQ
jgi:cell division protein FtsB